MWKNQRCQKSEAQAAGPCVLCHSADGSVDRVHLSECRLALKRQIITLIDRSEFFADCLNVRLAAGWAVKQADAELKQPVNVNRDMTNSRLQWDMRDPPCLQSL